MLLLISYCFLLVSQQAMREAESTACGAALTSTSGTPARRRQRLLKIIIRIVKKSDLLKFNHICSKIFPIKIVLQIILNQSWKPQYYVHSPCPDRSRYRLCVSVLSNISKVYLPLSFSVGLKISIQTFCILLPGFVLVSWSILLSLHW